MKSKTSLLVEDNPSDIDLAKRALAKGRVANELVVTENGQEGLDYLFGTVALTFSSLPKPSRIRVCTGWSCTNRCQKEAAHG
jgi:CheY-like chemotaxis protein